MNDTDALHLIDSALEESASVKQSLRGRADSVLPVARRMVDAFRAGGHLYACGNGGSACDAMHFVEELVARYKMERPGLPAHHLLDAPTLTCWSNDYEYTTAFQRQIETLIRPGDVFVGISTSGNSPNVVLAAEAAKRLGAWTVGLVGEGGTLAEVSSAVITVPSKSTARIQEAHITIIHILCELVEQMLFGDGAGEPGKSPGEAP